MVTGPLFQTKLHLLHTDLPSGFLSSRELSNPRSKAIPGKFHGSDGHSKHNYLQDLANFHRSRAWQIVLSFNATECMLFETVLFTIHQMSYCQISNEIITFKYVFIVFKFWKPIWRTLLIPTGDLSLWQLLQYWWYRVFSGVGSVDQFGNMTIRVF